MRTALMIAGVALSLATLPALAGGQLYKERGEINTPTEPAPHPVVDAVLSGDHTLIYDGCVLNSVIEGVRHLQACEQSWEPACIGHAAYASVLSALSCTGEAAIAAPQ